MKVRKIIRIIFAAICLIGLAYFVAQIAAFRYGEEQITSAIVERIAREANLSPTETSLAAVETLERNNLRVVTFIYSDHTADVPGVAVFTKLPGLSQYRFDRLFLKAYSDNFATVVDTGLTQEMAYRNGAQIVISSEGLGYVTRAAIWMALYVVALFVVTKVIALDAAAKASAKSDEDNSLIIEERES